jgi:hypothetical protein
LELTLGALVVTLKFFNSRKRNESVVGDWTPDVYQVVPLTLTFRCQGSETIDPPLHILLPSDKSHSIISYNGTDIVTEVW